MIGFRLIENKEGKKNAQIYVKQSMSMTSVSKYVVKKIGTLNISGLSGF